MEHSRVTNPSAAEFSFLLLLPARPFLLSTIRIPTQSSKIIQKANRSGEPAWISSDKKFFVLALVLVYATDQVFVVCGIAGRANIKIKNADIEANKAGKSEQTLEILQRAWQFAFPYFLKSFLVLDMNCCSM